MKDDVTAQPTGLSPIGSADKEELLHELLIMTHTDRPKFKVLDLFSGIGGFSLGLERTGGFETVAFCEIEEYPRRVLAKHWPRVPIYHDVRELTADTLRRDGIAVDVICGGFPCQDISCAGLRAGLAGERSGLWSEYARLIGELRPGFVVMENVSDLLGNGLADVLRDLAAIRYDAEWHAISAAHMGAPHERDRLWLVAYPDEKHGVPRLGFLANHQAALWRAQDHNSSSVWMAPPDKPARVGDGLSHWVDRRERTECLGNAVVPQIPELIGRAILEAAE